MPKDPATFSARLMWVVVGVFVGLPIAAAIVGIKLGQFRAMDEASAGMTAPPEPVNAFEVREMLWHSRLTAVGSVAAIRGTVVRTESEGVVRRIGFTPGARVRAGDPLVELDDTLEQAQLREAEAAARLARVTLQRAQALGKTRNIAEGEVDRAQSGLDQATARVGYFRELIARKTVRAPFDGMLGISRLSIGQYLSRGAQVVSLQSLDTVYVDFSVPQQRLAELAAGLEVTVFADAYPGTGFNGRVSAIDPDIDPATRNVRVQATLANPEHRLRPGMFVSLELRLDHQETVLLIPSTAVAHGPHGTSVFVIEPAAEGGQATLRQQMVRLGQRRGDFVVATEGLAVGQQVVSTGVFKLWGGMPVVIDNSLAPEFRLEPTPGNT